MSGPGDATKAEKASKRMRYIKRHRVRRRRSVNKGRNIALVVLAALVACGVFFLFWYGYSHQTSWVGKIGGAWQDRP